MQNMQPKVTIIIPVYNVEKYLRQCLDSIVNQTMQDIQIICVNDGSTDGSPAILEEYAAQDPRIEVYHQENQGGGSARNAAYPYIRGKYAYFADPDDWLELDLCQQCYDRVEVTEADFVALRFFGYKSDHEWCWKPFDTSLPEIRQSSEEKYEILQYAAPWRAFLRSEFLLSQNIRFVEGKRPYNDMLAFWKWVVLANRIVIHDNPLYHYRQTRSDSYQQTLNEKHLIIIETYNDIENMLKENGCYDAYKEFLFPSKFGHYCTVHSKLPHSLQPRFLRHIRRHWTKDDREYCRNVLPSHPDKNLRDFYISQGFCGRFEMQKYYFDCLKEINTEMSRQNEEFRAEVARLQSEIQRQQSEFTLLLNKDSINKHYYRYKLLSKLTCGKKRKHYKSKRNLFHDKVRQIRLLSAVSPPPPTFRQRLKKINRTVVRPLENFVRFLRGKPMKTVQPVQMAPTLPAPVQQAPMQQKETDADRQIQELSELACQLSKEVVELREELQQQSGSNTITQRAA
jgi:glycosyltransferase involved in cell wall biosynthesis